MLALNIFAFVLPVTAKKVQFGRQMVTASGNHNSENSDSVTRYPVTEGTTVHCIGSSDKSKSV